ncbi:hypothetical protein [Cyclobacterium xiamenense]|uniref:hypothetical protein n=1 Tax=Cyclobacterium xiamenense TaxID=1297121 RepID=UPI0035CF791B
MNLSDFKESIQQGAMPKGISVFLQALWLEKSGDWDGAHGLIDSLAGQDAAYLHAFLHRREGDLSNAAYWYRRAGKPIASGSLEEEWELQVIYFLAD